MVLSTLAYALGIVSLQSQELLRNSWFDNNRVEAWTIFGAESKFVPAGLPTNPDSVALRLNFMISQRPYAHMFQAVPMRIRRGQQLTFDAVMRSATESEIHCVLENKSNDVKQFVSRAGLSTDWKHYRFTKTSDRDYGAGELVCGLYFEDKSAQVDVAKVSLQLTGVGLPPREGQMTPERPRMLIPSRQAVTKTVPPAPVVVRPRVIEPMKFIDRVEEPHRVILPSAERSVAHRVPPKPAVAPPERVDYFADPVGQLKLPASADERIEKLRIGDLHFVVVDAAGRQVPNSTVELTQVNSDFRFGTVSSSSLLTEDNEGSRRYRAELVKRFNTVELKRELSWSNEEVLNNRLEMARSAAIFLKQQGMFIRGGALTYRDVLDAPQSMRDQTPDQWRTAVNRHILAEMKALGDSVYLWDVTTDAAAPDFWGRLGLAAINDAFVTAHAANSNALLSYADSGIEAGGAGRISEVTKQLTWMRSNLTPVNVVSDSLSRANTTVPMMLKHWDEISRQNLRVEVTDVVVGSGDAMRELLTAAYSHPYVDGLILASFWAGDGLGLEGTALAAQDWSSREALVAWDDLVLHRWRSAASTTTDAGGRGVIRGYYGTYKARIRVGDEWYETYVGHHNYAKESARIVLKR